MKLPSFDFRKWYQTDVTTLEQVERLFLNTVVDGKLFFRGMPRYEYICISTFYRYFIDLKKPNWIEKDVGFNSMVLLPEIDIEEYKLLSFKILDDFYNNLKIMGSKELDFNVIMYLAQHYGLPTDLIDFSYDPKVALYFACSKDPEYDCNIYMFDIYSRVKQMMEMFRSGNINFFLTNLDGTPMNEKEREQYAKKGYTVITRDGLSTVTPIITLDDIQYSRRIQNQKGTFIYHRNTVPMDQLMYTASPNTSYPGRRIYKVNKELKPIILEILDEKYGINESFLLPNSEVDINLEIIERSVAKTKERFSL